MPWSDGIPHIQAIFNEYRSTQAYQDPTQALLVVTYFHPFNFQEVHEYTDHWPSTKIRSDLTEFETLLQYITAQEDIEIIGYNRALELQKQKLHLNNWNLAEVCALEKNNAF